MFNYKYNQPPAAVNTQPLNH